MAISLTAMSAVDRAPMQSVSALAQYEETPIDQRIAEQNTYDLLCAAAQAWGEKPAITFLPHGLSTDTPIPLTYRQLLYRVTQIANTFREMGLDRQDSVGILAPNLPDTYTIILAAQTAGVANPVNPLLSTKHIKNIMSGAGVKILVTVSEAADADIFAKACEVRAALGEDVKIIVLDQPQADALFLPDVIKNAQGDQLIDIEPATSGDLASAFHTGGTTSAPKLVGLTHKNQLSTVCMGMLGSGHNSDDVAIGALPVFHVIGGVATPLMTLATGMNCLLCGPAGYRNPYFLGDFWNLIEKYKITFVPVVPTVLSALAQIPIQSDISSMKTFMCGAAPLPLALIEAIKAKTGAEVVETYGMTEASTSCACNPVAGEKRAGSVGPPVAYQEIFIAQDPHVETLSPTGTGQVGHVLVRGPNVVATTQFPRRDGEMQGEESVRSDGWLKSGDLGWFDEDGYLWLQGRAKDLIIRSGHNIDPRIVEEVLVSHPVIDLAAAVGQPDGYAGEVPVAYVTLKSGQTADTEDLEQFAREHISERPAAPARIEILETMPLTSIGKIYKPKLQVLAANFAAFRELQSIAPSEVQFDLQACEAAPGARREVSLTFESGSSTAIHEFKALAIAKLANLNLEPIFETGGSHGY